MATLINKGWLYLTDGSDIMRLACEQIIWDWPWNPDITDYANSGHYGYDLGEESIIIKVKGIIFKTLANHDIYLSNLRAWQKASGFDLKVQVTTGGTFKKLDGTNTVFPCLSFGPLGNEKVAKENQEIYKIKTQLFRVAGTPS